MTPEETERKKARRRLINYCSGACLCCLIIGFLIGVALDAKYRPNNILLYINPDGKESLSPLPGDIISFASNKDLSLSKVNVTYTAGLAPCDPTSPFPAPTCVYKPFAHGPDLYLFGCTFGSKSMDCYDPQYGPQCVGCGSGPSTGGLFPHPHPTLPLLKVVIWDIGGPFRVSPDEQILPQRSGAPSGESQGGQKIDAQVHEVTSATAPPRLQEFVAACDPATNKPAIFAPGKPAATTTILAEPGDTITWNPYADYTTAGLGSPLNPPICVDGNNPSSSGNESCEINSPLTSKTYQYTLEMTCGGVSSSTPENIQIQNPTVAVAGKK
jgi:hypothetical protein